MSKIREPEYTDIKALLISFASLRLCVNYLPWSGPTITLLELA